MPLDGPYHLSLLLGWSWWFFLGCIRCWSSFHDFSRFLTASSHATVELYCLWSSYINSSIASSFVPQRPSIRSIQIHYLTYLRFWRVSLLVSLQREAQALSYHPRSKEKHRQVLRHSTLIAYTTSRMRNWEMNCRYASLDVQIQGRPGSPVYKPAANPLVLWVMSAKYYLLQRLITYSQLSYRHLFMHFVSAGMSSC